MEIGDLATWFTGIISFVGLWMAFCQLRQIKNQQKLDYYNEFTNRYREIMVNLPLLDTQDKFDDCVLRWYAAYFDLCCEQQTLRKMQKFNDEIWIDWEQGIQSSFQKPNYQQAWKQLAELNVTYQNLDKYVKKTTIKEL